MAARRQVRRAVTVAAPPDVVWQALVDDELAAQWLGGPSQPAHAAAPGRLHEADGTTWTREVVSADRGQRLVYWWWRDTGTVPAVGDVSVVEIDLDRDGPSTRVTVTETALADHDDLPLSPDGSALPLALRGGGAA